MSDTASPNYSTADPHQYEQPSLGTARHVTPPVDFRAVSPLEGRPLSVLTADVAAESSYTIQTERTEPSRSLYQALNPRVRIGPAVFHGVATVRNRPRILTKTKWRRAPLFLAPPFGSSANIERSALPLHSGETAGFRRHYLSLIDIPASSQPIGTSVANNATIHKTTQRIIPPTNTQTLYRGARTVQRSGTIAVLRRTVKRVPTPSVITSRTFRATSGALTTGRTLPRPSLVRPQLSALHGKPVRPMRQPSMERPTENSSAAEPQREPLRVFSGHVIGGAPAVPFMRSSTIPRPRPSPSVQVKQNQVYGDGAVSLSPRAVKPSSPSHGACISISVFFIVVAVVSLVGIAGHLGVMTKLDRSFYIAGGNRYVGRFRVTGGDYFHPDLLNNTSLDFERRSLSYSRLLERLLRASRLSEAVASVSVDKFAGDQLTVVFSVDLNDDQLPSDVDDAAETIRQILVSEAASSSSRRVFKTLNIDFNSITVERAEGPAPFGLFISRGHNSKEVDSHRETSESSNTHDILDGFSSAILPEIYSVRVGAEEGALPELALGPYVAASSDSQHTVSQNGETVLTRHTLHDQVSVPSVPDYGDSVFSASSNTFVVKSREEPMRNSFGSKIYQERSDIFSGSDLLNKEVLAESAEPPAVFGTPDIVYPPTDPPPVTFTFSAPRTYYDDNPWEPFQPVYAPSSSLQSTTVNPFFLPSNVLINRMGTVSDDDNSIDHTIPINNMKISSGKNSRGGKSDKITMTITNDSPEVVSAVPNLNESEKMHLNENENASEHSVSQTIATNTTNYELNNSSNVFSPSQIGLFENTSIDSRANVNLNTSESVDSTENKSNELVFSNSNELEENDRANDEVLVSNERRAEKIGVGSISLQKTPALAIDGLFSTVSSSQRKELLKRTDIVSNSKIDETASALESYMTKFSNLLKQRIKSVLETSSITPFPSTEKNESEEVENSIKKDDFPIQIKNPPETDESIFERDFPTEDEDYVYYDTEFFSENSNLANIFKLISTKKPLLLILPTSLDSNSKVTENGLEDNQEKVVHPSDSHKIRQRSLRSAFPNQHIIKRSPKEGYNVESENIGETKSSCTWCQQQEYTKKTHRQGRSTIFGKNPSLASMLSAFGMIPLESTISRIGKPPVEAPAGQGTSLLSNRLFSVLGWKNVNSKHTMNAQPERHEYDRSQDHYEYPFLENDPNFAELGNNRDERSFFTHENLFGWRKIGVNRRGLFNSLGYQDEHYDKPRFLNDYSKNRPYIEENHGTKVFVEPHNAIVHHLYKTDLNSSNESANGEDTEVSSGEVDVNHPDIQKHNSQDSLAANDMFKHANNFSLLEEFNRNMLNSSSFSVSLTNFTLDHLQLTTSPSPATTPLEITPTITPSQASSTVSVFSSISSDQSEHYSVEITVDSELEVDTKLVSNMSAVPSAFSLATRLRNYSLTGCSSQGSRLCANKTDRCSSPLSRCDFITDCQDGSDEANCSCADHLRSQGLHEKICDGQLDCQDLSDEQQCDWCRVGQYVCPGSKKCVDTSSLCDGTTDCPDGADEQRCLALSDSLHLDARKEGYRSSGYLLLRHRGQWSPLCADRFDEHNENAETSSVSANHFGDYVCNRLTYSRAQNVFRVKSTSSHEQQRTKLDYFQLDFLPESYAAEQNLSPRRSECRGNNTLYITCSQLQCGARRPQQKRLPRVVGGSDISPGDWPWSAAMFREGEYQCGATLISSSWLVSAAHCYVKSLSMKWVARLGDFRRGGLFRSPNEIIREVSTIEIHPQYKDEGYINDIALIQLDKRAKLSDFVRPICLPSADWEVQQGQLCSVIGWGQLFESGHIFPDTLQQVELPVIATEQCQRQTRHLPLYRVTSGMLCAGFAAGGKDACLGDSGGPLMCQTTDSSWQLTGITSNGYGCARAGRPGVYTKVVRYLDWIDAVMSQPGTAANQSDTCSGMRCPLGRCIGVDNICDGVVQCSDGSDETGCHVKS